MVPACCAARPNPFDSAAVVHHDVGMTAVLPETRTVRPPTRDDAEAVFELLSADNMGVIGFADYTRDDAVDELTAPGFDPATDGWLVFDGDRLVGFGSVFGKGDHHQLDIDLISADPAVVAHLLGEVTRRAREIAQAYGHPSLLVDIGVYRADESLAERGCRSTASRRVRRTTGCGSTTTGRWRHPRFRPGSRCAGVLPTTRAAGRGWRRSCSGTSSPWMPRRAGPARSDTINPTPALGLYLSVGMMAALVIDIWQLKVDAA